jgi:hypothetical protein
MRKNKKIRVSIVVVILAILYVSIVSDFRLANGENITKTDKLCGILITHGSREDYMETKIEGKELSKKDFSIDKNGNLQLKEDVNSLFTTKVEGRLVEEKTVNFPGIKGYFMGIIPLVKNGETTKGALADDEIHNVSLSINVTDQGVENNCEGVLRVLVKEEEIFNANPVYQRADGSFYVMLGENPGVAVTGDTVGSNYAMLIDNTNTSTQDNTTQTNKDTFKINIMVVDQVQNVYIKEMNDKDELINTTEFKKDDDKEFSINSDTAYIIVDEVYVDKDNTKYRLRNSYSFNSNDKDKLQTHLCNFPGDDNAISGVEIEFVRK